jgi:hypothetical protein
VLLILWFFGRPHPIRSNLTPPSSTGRGRKYGEKMVIERGVSENKPFLPFSDSEKGAGDEVTKNI